MGFDLGFRVSCLAHLFRLFGSDHIEAFLDGLDGLNRGGFFSKGFLFRSDFLLRLGVLFLLLGLHLGLHLFHGNVLVHLFLVFLLRGLPIVFVVSILLLLRAQVVLFFDQLNGLFLVIRLSLFFLDICWFLEVGVFLVFHFGALLRGLVTALALFGA